MELRAGLLSSVGGDKLMEVHGGVPRGKNAPDNILGTKIKIRTIVYKMLRAL